VKRYSCQSDACKRLRKSLGRGSVQPPHQAESALLTTLPPLDQSESPSDPGDRDHLQEDNQAERDPNIQEVSVDQSMDAEPQDLDADMEDHDVSGQQADDSM
jgi:hypothetical protein